MAIITPAEQHRLSLSQIAIGQIAADDGRDINKAGIGAINETGIAVGKQELFGQVQHQQRAHSIVRKSFPHFREKQDEQPLWMPQKCSRAIAMRQFVQCHKPSTLFQLFSMPAPQRALQAVKTNQKIAREKKIISIAPNPSVEKSEMFNDNRDLQKYLNTRRSGKPRDMAGARPDDATLHAIAATALRTPDHGKLTPWRMIVVEDDRRGAFRDLLDRAFRTANPNATDGQAAMATAMADYDAGLIITTFAPKIFAKIPVWEQELSAGAMGMNLLHAGHAHGFVGGWVSPWPCNDATVRAALCREEGERITGLFYFGTPSAPLEERERPDPAAVIRAF